LRRFQQKAILQKIMKTKFHHAGCPGSRASVDTERTINKSIKSPIIIPDVLLCSMDEDGLTNYLQSLTDYVIALGGSLEVVSAIFRTSILLGYKFEENMENDKDMFNFNN